MKLISRNHLEDWANRTDSGSEFPYLISRLIRAITPASTSVNIPSGSATFIGGWDGIVKCKEDTSYVPKGTSLWELGTGSNIKGKADEDYDKRTKNPLGYIPIDCIFIFVTLRFWKKKNKWIESKKSEGIWEDVRVYDSSDLEQWLDIALAPARWISGRLRIYPHDGVMTTEEYWEEWSISPKGLILRPEVIIAGRENEQDQLLSILNNLPSIKGIKASTKNEAIAFIIATALMFHQPESDRFFSKSLIIDTVANFRSIRINSTTPLNLIARFDDYQPLYTAVSRGHHVLIPLGADDDFNQEIITLPTIDRDEQVNSLVKSGMSESDAAKYSMESGRDVTILKRLIGFPHKSKILNRITIIREIIPALILGRWNDNSTGDIELIEKLSGMKYSNYMIILMKWLSFEESPLIRIGETWRLTSPLDLWSNLYPYLTENDFISIRESFAIAFQNGNPIIGEKDNDETTLFYKPRKYSDWVREGIVQSLILIAHYGERLNNPNRTCPQIWVDNIISDILYDASGSMWVSVDKELPLISEASPSSFLNSVNNSLAKEQPEILEMFDEVKGFLHPTSHHTGLLWALEGLAWLSEYLRDVSIALLKLAELDPGGSISNRPINSLTEIYKPWHYQTLSPFEERMEVLKLISSKENESYWELLVSMLPGKHDTGSPTHKMRWRMFDKSTNLNYTYREIWNTHSYVIELLFGIFDNSEKRFSQLIEKSIDLTPQDRNMVLGWAKDNYSNLIQENYSTWNTLRNILSRHRSFPDADWSLPEAVLLLYEELYKKMEPLDSVNKYIWLFNEYSPEFPEGFVYIENESEKRYQQKLKRIEEARTKALTIIINDFGLSAALELRKKVKETWSLGIAFEQVIDDEESILVICECLNDKREDLRFIHSFISNKTMTKGFDWFKSMYKTLEELKFDKTALSNAIIPLKQNRQLWDFISTLDKEVEDRYWKEFSLGMYNISTDEKVFGIQKLLEYNRFFSAIDVCSHFADDLPSKLIYDVLERTATEKANEQGQLKVYEIDRIFEALDSKTDLDNSKMIELEWYYLPIIDSISARRNPKVLEEELSKNPEFFVEVISWAYKSDDENNLEEEVTDLSEEVLRNRAKHAYHLLHSWERIPGMQADYSIDELELNNWVIRARGLAKDVGRLDVSDMVIGQLLATYPEDCEKWPQEKIFALIEQLNTKRLKNNYSIGLFNKRGSSTRDAFEGGTIERRHASYFEKLSEDYKYKFPNVANIFKNLSEGYQQEAIEVDERLERDKLEY